MANIQRSRALLGQACPIRAPSEPGRVAVLDALAPPLELPAVDGSTFRLESLRGRKVVLVFLRGFG